MVQRPTDRNLSGRNVLNVAGPADVSSGDIAFGQAVGQVGQVYLREAQRMIPTIAKAVVKDQEKKGRIAARSSTTRLPSGEIVPTQPQLREGVTLSAEAFNKGVMDATRTRFQTAIIGKVSELQARFPTDPGAFDQEFSSFYNGLTLGLPQEQRDEFDLMAARSAIPARERIFEKYVEIQNAKQSATVFEGINALEQEGRFQAQDLFSDNPEIAGRAAGALEDIAGQLSTLYDAEDLQGVPLFTAEQKVDAVNDFVQETLLVANRAGLAKAENKVGYITSLGARMNAMGVRLNEDQFQAIEDSMYQDLNQAINLENALEGRQRNRFDRFRLGNYEAMVQGIGQGLTRMEVEAAREDGLITLQQRNQLLAAISNPAQVSDPGAFLQLRQTLTETPGEFPALYAELNARLDTIDARTLLQEYTDFQQGGGFLNLELVKRAERQLRTIHQADGMLVDLNDQATIDYADAQRRFVDAVMGARTPQEAVEAANLIVDSEKAMKTGERPAQSTQKRADPDSVLVGKPDGTGLDLDLTTQRAAELLADPNTPPEQLQQILKQIEEQME